MPVHSAPPSGALTLARTPTALTLRPENAEDLLLPAADTQNAGVMSASDKAALDNLVSLAPFSYRGVWNAATNSPALASGTGTKGWLYKVSVAGSTALDGISQWNAGDIAVFNGTTWDKIDGVASEVLSVAGLTGVISAAALKAALAIAMGDVSGLPAFVMGSAPVPIASGGTGQTAAGAAFDALAALGLSGAASLLIGTQSPNLQNATYNFAASDVGGIVKHNDANPYTYTILPYADPAVAGTSVKWPLTFSPHIKIFNNSAAALTIALGTGVSLTRADGTAGTGARSVGANSTALIWAKGQNDWVIEGSALS